MTDLDEWDRWEGFETVAPPEPETGDQTNPFETTQRFAGEHEGANLIEFPSAPHTLEWNANEYAATQSVSAFLRQQ